MGLISPKSSLISLMVLFFSLTIILSLFVPSQSEYCSVALTSTITTVSPNTGLVLWPGSKASGAYKNSIALEYSYFSPNEITNTLDNDGKPIYNWQKVEDFLTNTHNNRHSAIIRFFYEYPTQEIDPVPTGVPDFVRQYPNYKEGSVNYQYGGTSKAPLTRVVHTVDWSNAQFRQFHMDFYTAFADRYNGDDRLAFIQVGFGWWSEYHLYNDAGTNVQLGQNFPSFSFQREFMSLIDRKFGSTPYSISIDAASDEYSDLRNHPESFSFGLFDDSFMHERHELKDGDDEYGYNEQCWIDLGAFSETKPLIRGANGGEVSYYTPDDQYNFLDAGGMYGHKFIDQAQKYQLSYLLANDAPEKAKNTPAVFKANSMLMGYEFTITNIQFDRAQNLIDVTIKNTGIAPSFSLTRVVIRGYQSVPFGVLLPSKSVTIQVSGIDIAALEQYLVGKPPTDTSWINFESNKVRSPIQIPFAASCEIEPTTCTGNDQCDASKVCVNGHCIDQGSCTNNDDCDASSPVCSVDKKCVQCKIDDDCDASSPVCAVNKCVQCQVDNDCGSFSPFCFDSQCVECGNDNDCSEGLECSSNNCRQPVCTNNDDCQDGFDCVEGFCERTNNEDPCIFCQDGEDCIDEVCVPKNNAIVSYGMIALASVFIVVLMQI